MKKALVALLLFISAYCHSQTVGLQGTVHIPNAQNFNGFIRIKTNVANIKNICTTPFQQVPTINVVYPITNGVVTGATGAAFLSQDCMMPRVPYYVQISDSNNNLVSSDNWYLPQVLGGVVDVGDMQEEGFGGPITVAVPLGIVSTPGLSQTITQPATTSFNFVTSGGGKLLYNGVEVSTGTSIPDPLPVGQLLVNGAPNEGHQIEVIGSINAGGYLVNGAAPVGTCLVGNGSIYVSGSCGAALPTLYYQQVTNLTTAFNHRSQLSFRDQRFVVQDNGPEASTDIFLRTTGLQPFLMSVANPLPNNTNCLQGDGSGGITASSGPCYTPTSSGTPYTCSGGKCWRISATGQYEMWATGGVDSSNGTISQTIALPKTCPSGNIDFVITSTNFISAADTNDIMQYQTSGTTANSVTVLRARRGDDDTYTTSPTVYVVCH